MFFQTGIHSSSVLCPPFILLQLSANVLVQVKRYFETSTLKKKVIVKLYSLFLVFDASIHHEISTELVHCVSEFQVSLNGPKRKLLTVLCQIKMHSIQCIT